MDKIIQPYQKVFGLHVSFDKLYDMTNNLTTIARNFELPGSAKVLQLNISHFPFI